MVDALASGASGHYARGGSNPLIRTKSKIFMAIDDASTFTKIILLALLPLKVEKLT